MDNDLRDVLNKYKIIPKRLTIKNNVRIIDDKYVIKKHKNNNLDNTYNYLKSRAFNYFPIKVKNDNNYDIYEYISDISEPIEQKAQDLMYLLSLLHSKTTFYKEVDIDKYKEIYEDINNKLDYLYNYYNDIITLIERNIYMSPSSYLIARNIDKIFNCIYYGKREIDSWYKIIKDKRKMRLVTIHNNINLDHYLKKDKPYLVSWDNSKIDMPIYDLYNFYKNHYLDLDFSELFNYYESRYPLKEEERKLLFVMMMLPEKIDFNDKEYNLCVKIRKFIDYIYKTENLINEYQSINDKRVSI